MGEAATTPACVVGVGVNCTAPEHVAGVLRTLAEAAGECRPPPPPRDSLRGESTAEEPASAPAPEATNLRKSSTTAPAVVRDEAGVGGSPRIALVAYPNSGEEWDAAAREWVEGTGLRGLDGKGVSRGNGESGGGGGGGGGGGAEEFGRLARDEWYLEGKGAQIIGGCCRTRPTHVAEIRRALASGAVVVERDEKEGHPSRHAEPSPL